ncbi:hypothetical protein FIBSPDRAFT_914860 [Athelia psychrophila]|uniref:Uncharacterized protein n=1 Tax=Athelia psychrophila TaxID=1759441 RepID=A0A167W0T5_9AGAM|nr:hypothetical protein FIBSPDRAFT_914860 [Fibularhizoctonia sp. CBS 109695]
MTEAQLRQYQDLQEVPIEDPGSDHEEGWAYEDVLQGRQDIPISHEGGELNAIREIHGMRAAWVEKKRIDFRTRRDRTDRHTRAFQKEIPGATQAFMDWSLRKKEGWALPEEEVEEESSGSGGADIRVVDVFTTYDMHILYPAKDTLLTALVRRGFIPCAPTNPSVCITIDALELFRVTNLRSPHLSIHAFIKALCDLHGTPFKRYLATQFSIAHDLHLTIRANIDKTVQKLLFELLFTMDGNDSLKRIVKYELGADGEPLRTCEGLDSRKVTDDLFLARDEVNKWAIEGLQDLMGDDFTEDNPDADYNPCIDRWKNMKADITKRMWGIFDETGIFLALCRHGFALVIADMVRSGEMAKYPLSVVAIMLKVFGKDLGGGYDIGCKLKGTLTRSPLAQLVHELNYSSLVGSFHGHAHRRLCQLVHLATYVRGLGLEDLEGCERAFSKSNALAGSTRHASVFHRIQAIDAYFKHNDDAEVFANLTLFEYNNYKQCTEILESGPTALATAMHDLGITDTAVFEECRVEERVYLEGLSHEPLEETLQMEYYQKLVNLAATTLTPEEKKARATRRKIFNKYEKDLMRVLDLEEKLQIETRWTPECQEWRDAATLVSMSKYQLALDNLEGLIVARMFELTKMNMSQTGYKMRKHIAKALQSCSHAIRTALDNYNTATRALNPPRQQLEWSAVVEYAFLADFDLLRDARQDNSQKLWAKPAGRLAMDLYYKIMRAGEERDRLNVEIRHIVTYLRDEEQYLRRMEATLHSERPELAHQISVYAARRGHFYQQHHRRLIKIANLPGFTGTLEPGVALENGHGEPASVWSMLQMDVDGAAPAASRVADEAEDEDNVSEDRREAEAEGQASDEEEEMSAVITSIIQLAFD